MDLTTFACPHEECPDFGKEGAENLRVHDRYGSGEWARLKCKTCGRTFSERQGTPLFRLHIPEEKVVQILILVTRGASLRTTEEAVGVDQNTVMRVVKVAGEHAKWFHEHMVRNLKVGQVQADEIYTYVKKRRRKQNAKTSQ